MNGLSHHTSEPRFTLLIVEKFGENALVAWDRDVPQEVVQPRYLLSLWGAYPRPSSRRWWDHEKREREHGIGAIVFMSASGTQRVVAHKTEDALGIAWHVEPLKLGRTPAP